MNRADLTRYRSDRDAFFGSNYASPIPEEQLPTFDGLTYFEANPAMTFTGDFEPTEGDMLDIVSTAGTSSRYHRMGTLHIDLFGAHYDLVVLDDGDGEPFIPFGDTTNGTETYGGGRYVSVDIHDDGSGLVDFDLAQNPYCVYDEEFVCPLPPSPNRIAAPIQAGERMYRAER